jgi:ATP adenylyltransferase
MNENPWQPPFAPGTLRERLFQAYARALASNALTPIPTSFTILRDQPIPFVVRIVDNLRRKQQALRTQRTAPAPSNPFLPCDKDLYVADVSDTHVAVLNKFNVIDHHLLIVTRAFEHQDELLTCADFHALWRCLREIDGLGFYNGGTVAGASQQHKHLQLAPYPITEEMPGVPIDAVIETSLGPEISTVDALPFSHAVCSCPDGWRRDAQQAACESHARYLELMRAMRVIPTPEGQPAPYNLLVTHKWMMMVPRSREFFEGMSINAIGYAGGLLVRNDEELRRVVEVGPMEILSSVGVGTRGASAEGTK